jgi:FKBP-type peptidyl-prolyl cis-trans isomerase FkpA
MIKRRTGRTLGLAVTVTLALVACGDEPLGPEPRDVEFAASLGIDLDNMTETASGLFFRDDEVGTGPVVALDDHATVTYSGWLADGTLFDSGQFEFDVSALGAIAGFVEGVTGMQVGGERTIVVPAELGYRSAGQGSIPGDAVLIFNLILTALS